MSTDAPATNPADSAAAAPAAEQPKAPEAPKQPAAAPVDTALALRTKDGQELSYDYGEFAGVGSSTLPTSGYLPYLTVLQPLSKAVTEGNEKFVAGARPGMFLLGGQENRLLDGKKGVIFVPIHDRHLIVEKTSLDGKGKTVNKFDGDPKGPTATALRAKFGTNRSQWKSEAGNFMVERHDVSGVLFESVEDVAAGKPLAACIVGFERTKMRAFNRMSDGFDKYEPRKRPPLFALMTKLTIALEKGDKADYYNINLSFPVQDDFARSLIPPTAPNFRTWGKQCMAVIDAIGTGTLKSKEEEHDDAPPGGATDGGKGPDIPF